MKRGRKVNIILRAISIILVSFLSFVISFSITKPTFLPVFVENYYIGEDGKVYYQLNLTENNVTINGNETTEDDDSDSGGGGGSASTDINTETIIGLSKAVAENFHIPYGGKEYSYIGNVAVPTGSPKGWVSDPLVINGKSADSGGALFRDCSTYCSLMRFYLGLDDKYVHRNSVGLYSLNDTGAKVYGDMKPGDIIVSSGEHAEMCIANDGTDVLIGSCGSPDSIERTATNGYSHKVSCGTSITTFRDGKGKVVR